MIKQLLKKSRRHMAAAVSAAVMSATVLFSAVLPSFLLVSCVPTASSPAPADNTAHGQTENTKAAREQQEFDAFTESLYMNQVTATGIDLHFNLADPSARGISQFPATFGEYTLDSIKEEMEMTKHLKKQLRSFHIRDLNAEQKLTYQILSTYLDTELSASGLELYFEPLTSTIGIQAQLPILLSEYAFYTKKDVDDYLSLLAAIDTYYAQILEFEKQKSAAGLFMSDRAAGHVLESCEAYLLPPEHSFLSETFDDRINELTDLEESEKESYRQRHLKILEEHFIPAYRLLFDGITSLKGTGINDMGLCGLPDGKAYYEYKVNSNIAPSYRSVSTLKKAVQDRMDSDLSAMAAIIKDHPEIEDLLGSYEFRYSEPVDCLNFLKEQINTDFPAIPENSFTVKYVPKSLETSLSPAFYLVPPLDRYEDNTIYINRNDAYSNEELFPTLAHEGYPGHLYQNVYLSSSDICDLRHLMSFNAYSEGWATYVEIYSYTMEDNGLNPQLGALLAHNSALSLGIYAYLDIAINYDGWDRDQTQEYLSAFYDISDETIVDSVYDSLVENPTNYLSYYVGFLEISEMRDTAQKVLKDRFHLKDFHQFILDTGPAQFSVIQPKFQVWLTAQKNR